MSEYRIFVYMYMHSVGLSFSKDATNILLEIKTDEARLPDTNKIESRKRIGQVHLWLQFRNFYK